MTPIAERIAAELAVKPSQIAAAVALLDEGATVPFIARYRKEQTGALDDTQLRHLEERLHYLRELEERRSTILDSIETQGKLSDELAEAIKSADTKSRLEDLYLPYKPKRRTKAQIAREQGLEPLADQLFEQPDQVPETVAEGFINAEAGVADAKAALDGAKQILMERFAENATLLDRLRQALWQDGRLWVQVVAGKEQEGQKFRDYFDYDEALSSIPSHRLLAVLRGRSAGILQARIDLAVDEGAVHPCETRIASEHGIVDQQRPADAWLQEVVRWTWRVKLHTHLETDLLGQLRERAEDEAIQVFSKNLKDVLLAAPAGARPTLGLDPGLRTGVKVAVVDATGKLLDHTTIYPHAPRNQWAESLAALAALCSKHGVELVSIGNGTGSRETDKLVADLMKAQPELKLTRIMVSEAGASVYSASDYAAREFPDLDVTIRGAVSIARRLQDPLAELVKIEPKSIGVGQYQHDVSQVKLARGLDAVVEDCVNAVGVDVNMASAPLLARVSGLNTTLAKNIVAHREQHGRFSSREALKQVTRFGDKTFEQAAGFLRIVNGDNPLDASAVHPESYPVVERIASHHHKQPVELVGNTGFWRGLSAQDFVDDGTGLYTVKDIIAEMEKPGRDPRPEFKFASFQEGIETLSDLKPSMVLEGTVTNVTNFGAFVDIGVHQDGLVHISMLANRFIKDPREVVKAGDIVKVKVLEVDQPRKRIALSMRMDDEAVAPKGKGKEATGRGNEAKARPNGPRKAKPGKPSAQPASALALALQAAQKKAGKRP